MVTSPDVYNDLSLTLPTTMFVKPSTTRTVSGAAINDSWAGGHNGLMFLGVSVENGTIAMTDGSGNAIAGSGTHSIELQGTLSQLNADLSTLSYSSPASGNSGITFDVWNQAGVESRQSEVISTTTNNYTDLSLTLPGSTQNLSGTHINDIWADGHAGTMALNLIATNGTISLTDLGGNHESGGSFHFDGSFTQLNQLLSSLSFAGNGSGGVTVDVWNEAGIETTQSIAENGSTTAYRDISLTAPAEVRETPGSTSLISGVQIHDAWAAHHSGVLALDIVSTNGTVSMTDSTGHAVAGSGTGAIHLQGSLATLDAELSTLSYHATGTADNGVIKIDAFNQAGVETLQSIDVALANATAHDLSITTPSSETFDRFSIGNAITGVSINDDWAANHVGTLALDITSHYGALFMSDLNGNPVTGSGTEGIHIQGTYAQLEHDLSTLHYNATGQADAVRIDVFNQAGVESAQSFAIHLSSDTIHYS